jgi:hypothetical protein
MTTQLIQCTNCGRYGWHPTERCPEPNPPLASIPAPADAERLDPWMRDGGDGPEFRRFTIHTAAARPRRGGPVKVRVEGEQFSNGAEQRMITIDESDGLGALTGNDARELAVVLLDAAERLDGHRCRIVRNAAELRAALAAYNSCDDDESHERAASLLAAAVTRLLR